MFSLVFRKKSFAKLAAFLVATAMLVTAVPYSTEAAEAPVVTLTGATIQTVNFAEGEVYTDLGATCIDSVDGTLTAVPTWTMPDPIPGFFSFVEEVTFHYTCTNTAGLLGTSAERTVKFIHAKPAACNDGGDNDEDGAVDFPEDPGCASAEDDDESDPVPACIDGIDNDEDGLTDFPADTGCTSEEDDSENSEVIEEESTGSSRGGGRSTRRLAGEVLGASTSQGEVLGASCTMYITTFIKFGNMNDVEDVKRLQIFLNEEMGINLPITGYFGPMTMKALKDFQVKYKDEVLTPWVSFGLTADEAANGTGYVYKTTQRFINNMKCKELNLPLPQLP